MANPKIIPKKSTVVAKVPMTSDLESGEICINHADKKLYAKHPSTGAIQEIGGMLVHSHDELYSPDSSQVLELQNNSDLTITAGGSTKTFVLPSASGTIATLSDITASVAGVTSVNTRTGAVTIDKTDVGLGNVDNTSDANKQISTATQTALDGKAATAHTHTLSQLTQSGATSGQVPTWSGSAWVPTSPTYFQAYEHFITGAGIGLLGLTYAGLNGGSITQVTTNPAVFGAIRMATANNSTANTGARINGSGNINNFNPKGVGEFRFVSRIMRFSTDFFSPTIRGIFRTGVADSINAGPSNGFFFSCQETNAVNFNTVAGGVTTSTPTGFSITKDQWNLFEFIISSNGLSVQAKINGNVVATHTTNIPNAYMFPITNMLKYQADAGLVQLDVDYIYISLIQ